ncbi:MAG: AGE family epimerase/isomerase [Chloroflexota bacterium]
MSETTRKYVADIKKHILEGIMPFWDNRCLDSEYGGYITCFDRQGNITDTNKYIWFQGRQLYTYSLLYNKIEKRQQWLDLASAGYDFLLRHAYAGDGRWNFALTREGKVTTGTNSIYSDYHVAQGLAEYLLTTGCSDEKGMEVLEATFSTIEKNTMDPDFKDVFENTWSPTLIWHDMHLTALNTAFIAGQALGRARVGAFEDYCLDKILNWFMRDEKRLVFEAVTRDNMIDTSPVGSFINPGHSLESMWFCLETGRLHEDRAAIQKALQGVDWAYRVGWDSLYGGIFAYLNAEGTTPEPFDWHRETNTMWDDKIWWVNCEALCCFAVSYAASLDKKYLDMFEKQHDFCMKHFYDPEYGEWYERLYRDGAVKVSDKGTQWKCAFHLVRSLVQVIIAFDRIPK